MNGKLSLVPTPIGNLKDITFRAIEVLQQADTILAEDTRTSGKLLSHYSIVTPTRPYHMHNEHKMLSGFIDQLKLGQHLALISDAGTPAISDPGYLLLREALRNDIEVECLPGATAFIPALLLSGLPAHSFVFEGFLPVKKGRQTKLKAMASESRTQIFYESPHRMVKTLENFAEYLDPNRAVSASREITKLYEETIRGTVAEVLEHFKNTPPKGEFVICLAGVG